MNEEDIFKTIQNNPMDPSFISYVNQIKDPFYSMSLLKKNIHPIYLKQLISNLSNDDLISLINTTVSIDCREEAIYRVKASDDYFQSLLDKDLPTSTKLEIINRIESENIIYTIALNTNDSTIGIEIVKKIKSSELLLDLLINAKCTMVRISALKFLPRSYEKEIVKLVIEGDLPYKLADRVVQKIHDQELLFELFIAIHDESLQYSILCKITQMYLLLTLKMYVHSQKILNCIKKKIEEINAEK